MSKNGAGMDYKFGRKNNWRRSVWNSIAERIDDRKNAIVVYLRGPQDLDRAVAVSKGFSDFNLIACDRSASSVLEARQQKTLAIHGDLFQTIRAWPQNKKIDVLFGDFCCGLDLNVVVELSRIVKICPALHGAVLAFNWMRGRDPSTNDLRSYIRTSWDFSEDSKHRALIFWLYLMEQMVTDPDATAVDLDRLNKRFTHLSGLFPPSFFSYRSVTGQVFDSVVFKSPTAFIPTYDWSFALQHFRSEFGGKRRRKVAAVLAHRTMMKKKVGPYA